MDVSYHFSTKIFRIVHASLPVLHKLKDHAVVDTCSCTLHVAAYSFLDCVIVLVVLACDISGPQIGLRGPSVDWWMQKHLPTICVVSNIRCTV
jgi:hypothetical protein